MGVVQRQSLKNTIVNYLGIVIGALSTMFIYPLDWDLYGEIQFSLSTATLLSAFLSLGTHSLVNKYFPYFNTNKISGFLSLLFVYSALSVIFISLILYFFKNPIYNFLSYYSFDIELLNRSLFIIYPIAICYVFIALLRSQSFNYRRIVVPDLITNFSLKLVTPLIVLLGASSYLTFFTSGYILVVYHIIIVVLLLIYLKMIKALDFGFSFARKVNLMKHKEMFQYMIYGAFNHIGNILVYKIDIVMIGLLISSVSVGYYSIFLFLSIVIEIPTKAVFQITGPMVSQAFEVDDKKEVKKLYKKTSSSLYMIGVFLFGMIWLNLDVFFSIMTNGEDLVIYKNVFLILGLTKLLDMITSINFSIISYSQYFRVNTLFITILAISNILLNIYFIEENGIIGAAYATGISMLLFNLLKTAFVFVKFKMQPFDSKMLVITLFLVIFISIQMIQVPMIFMTIISLVFALLYIVVCYKMKISIELNKIIIKYLPFLSNK